MLKGNAPAGAYYLAGYALECALKACISKATERHDFPDNTRAIRSYTHNLKDLIAVASLKDAHDEAVGEYEFAKRWDTIAQWSEESRYQNHSLQEASDLIEAIENRQYGMLPWLKKRY